MAVKLARCVWEGELRVKGKTAKEMNAGVWGRVSGVGGLGGGLYTASSRELYYTQGW